MSDKSKPSATIISASEALYDVQAYQQDCAELSAILLSKIESLAQEAVSLADLPSLSMVLSEESFHAITIAPEAWLDEPYEDSFSFDGGTGDAGYHLGLHVTGMISEDGTADMSYQATLIKGDDTSVSRYDYATGTWNEDPALKQVVDTLNTGGPAADYITNLAGSFGADPLGISADVLLKSIQMHKPLIRLYDTLHGLAAFAFEIDKNSNIRPMLIPDDELRSGSAVFYENGKFHGCQYLPEDDALEALWSASDHADDWSDDLSYDTGSLRLCREVFTEKSSRRTASYLRNWWDHYSPDTSYSLPVSGSAVVLTSNPYKRIRNPITQHGPRELTERETKELERLRNHFRS